jgi:hypothetical protein
MPIAGASSFRPSTGDGPCASRPASEDRPVRVWVQGPRRGARTRGRCPRSPPAPSPLSHPSLLFTLLRLERAGAWECRVGPCCGELGDAGYPSARSSAARTGRLRPARRRRLRRVEEVVTSRNDQRIDRPLLPEQPPSGRVVSGTRGRAGVDGRAGVCGDLRHGRMSGRLPHAGRWRGH